MPAALSDLIPTQLSEVTAREVFAHVGAQPSSSTPAPALDAMVRGVSVASSECADGYLFVGVPGLVSHGAKYAVDAVARGAVAILTDEDGARICAAQCPGVPVGVVADPRAQAASAAGLVYGEPSTKMTILGVTGTNGKTTSAVLAAAALGADPVPATCMTTISVDVAGHSIPAARTTAEAPVINRVLAAGRERGVRAGVVEVSAHALSLDRVRGIDFAVVGFTNLQHDHLDYYGDMESYYRAKASLFTPDYARAGVVCVDDAWGRRLAAEAQIPVVTVATCGGGGDEGGVAAADWVATDIAPNAASGGTDFRLSGPDGASVAVYCPIPGLVNVQNSALALVMAHAAGVALERAAASIAACTGVPGRMEAIGQRGEDAPLVIVDYAHTPEAVAAVTETVRAFTPGRIHIVFGTDGDRDPSKRPDVGRAAAAGADVLWVTDENPRTEDAVAIRAQLYQGIRTVRADLHDVTEVTTCRRDAVRRAILAASPSDTVLITGKGAERTQEIDHCFHPYRDQDVAREALAGRGRKPR